MRVLFVASGNSPDFKINPFIKAQADSLIAEGITIDFYLISGKGASGYIKGINKLRRFLKLNKYDLIHAHYVLSGWCTVLSSIRIPILLSLMGSDAFGKYIGPNKVEFKSRYSILLTLLIQPFVKRIICKSDFIDSYVFQKKKSRIIPNGIDLEIFKPDNTRAHKELGLNPSKEYILYLGSKNDVWKNFTLIKNAISLINDPSIEILNPFPIKHEQVPHYINISSVTVLSSFMEGSPNIIKEAMACNSPIVATNVGDISWVLGDTEGCYLSSFDPADFASKLKMALSFSRKKIKTQGRKQIMQLGLDSVSIAKQIVRVYKEITNDGK